MRIPGWQARLAAWLSETAAAPFSYGQHDCALFAAGAVRAITGEDPAQKWRGRYSSFGAGVRALHKSGYSDHIAMARALFARTDTPRPGDLAILETPDGQALGVVQGAMIYAPAHVGWGLVPREAAIEFLEV